MSNTYKLLMKLPEGVHVIKEPRGFTTYIKKTDTGLYVNHLTPYGHWGLISPSYYFSRVQVESIQNYYISMILDS